MKWDYGEIMYDQEDIQSMDKWSDDKEMAFKIMDSWFDYLWRIEDGKIKFTDKLKDSVINDKVLQKREQNGTDELVFDTFEDVFKYILKISKGHEWYVKAVERRLQKGTWDEGDSEA